MKNNNFHFLLIAACIFGMVTSSQGARGLKSPAGGAIPQIIHMRSIPDAQPAGTQSVREIPFNCQSDKSQIDQLKIGASADDAVSSAVLPDLSAPMKASGGGGGGTVAPLHIGTKFTGPVQNGYIPYDAAIAVGPNHIVAMSNAQFAIYSKSGTLISLKQNSQFFPTDAGANTNPKCYYDASGHFVLFASQAQNPLAYMNVAVSQTSDPTGAWWMYHLDWTIDGSTNTGFWGSWPTLGYDDSAIYIAANQYSFATIYNASVFAYAKVRVLNKPQLFNGATATWTDFTNLHNADGTPAFCVTPGCMLSSGGSEYLLNNSAGGGSTVTMWRIDNAVSKPTLTLVATVPVGTYSIPPNARQAGRGSPYIATGDCRLQSVVMRGGVLYTALTVYYGGGKVKPGAGIRYLAISTSGSVSKNILYYTSGIDFYYPAVTVDASGNMFMVFSRSGPSEYASMYMTGMMTTETAIEACTLVKGGAGVVNNGRWGDYNGIVNDPSNSGAVWMYSGWEQSNGTWGSYVAATSFGVPPATQSLANAEDRTVRSYSLIANYPNPFNPSTMISYTLSEEAHARLVVYDAVGRQVAVLVDDVQTAGNHQVRFDASGLSSGVYFYRLEAGTNISMNRMLLAK